MSRLTLKGLNNEVETLKKDMADLKDSMNQTQELQKQMMSQMAQFFELLQNGNIGTTPEPVHAPVNIDDYAPTGWKGRKGYTTLRKAYSYAVCKAETGNDYEEETYKKASEEYRAKYYEEVKKNNK